MEALNEQLENTQDPGYLCGRLLAELENLQRKAVSNSSSTLVNRYYGGASTTPLMVFPNLVNIAQTLHLPTLRNSGSGAYTGFNERIEEILSKLSEYPAKLTLKQQSSFALGYYDQRAHDSAQRKKSGLSDKAVSASPKTIAE